MPDANTTFTQAVARFCAWAESQPHDLLSARQLLLALMTGVHDLAIPGSEEDDTCQYPHCSHEEYKALHRSFADLPFQYYRVCDAPLEIDDDYASVGDLHDDLADVYGDLLHGMHAMNAGNGSYALRFWRDSYFDHWGAHASEAFAALDAYYRANRGEQPASAPPSARP